MDIFFLFIIWSSIKNEIVLNIPVSVPEKYARVQWSSFAFVCFSEHFEDRYDAFSENTYRETSIGYAVKVEKQEAEELEESEIVMTSVSETANVQGFPRK